MQPLSKDCNDKVDPLAQSVEHNTFNVGVLGSSPKRITKNNPQETVDPLAQSVEHNTFNVGVLGSSPKRITKNNPQETAQQSLADFCITKWRFSYN